MIKKILVAILFLAVMGGYTVYYLWNKPHKQVENMEIINVSAELLSKEYGENEKVADSMYLDKAIEISGKVTQIDKNLDEGLMIIIQSADSTNSIQCSMREKGISVTKGQNVVIRGFCSGNGITGVSLTGCVLK
jgi:hypothetical protein